MKSLYVDDVISGTDTVDQGCRLKEVAVSVFGEAGFKMHKWHSNVEKLEAEEVLRDEGQTYAKEQLGVKPNEAKLLRLPWNKREDALAVSFKGDYAGTTTREVLKSLASVFDPLGVASPTVLVGKRIYREACVTSVSPGMQYCQRNWRNSGTTSGKACPMRSKFPAYLASAKEPVRGIDLHVFSDTSGSGTAAAVYAVIHQDSSTNQGLVTAKACLAKKGLTIPRFRTCVYSYGSQSCR